MDNSNFTMPEVKHSYGLHWLALTFPRETLLVDALPFAAGEIENSPVREWGVNGYNRHVPTIFGNIYWHAEQTRMKLHVIVNGEQCENLSAAGIGHEDYLHHAHEHGGLLKRLDFAADTFERSDPTDIERGLETGEVKVVAEKWSHVDSTNDEGGYTLNIGKRKDSRRFVRVYRKIHELIAQGFSAAAFIDMHWTRVELEAKADYAPLVGIAMRNHGIIQAGKAALRDFFVSHEIDWLQRLLEGDEGAYVPNGQRKETDSYKWHKYTTLPSLNQYLMDAPPEAGLDLINDMLIIAAKHKQRLQQEKNLGYKLQWYRDNPTD